MLFHESVIFEQHIYVCLGCFFFFDLVTLKRFESFGRTFRAGENLVNTMNIIEQNKNLWDVL